MLNLHNIQMQKMHYFAWMEARLMETSLRWVLSLQEIDLPTDHLEGEEDFLLLVEGDSVFVVVHMEDIVVLLLVEWEEDLHFEEADLQFDADHHTEEGVQWDQIENHIQDLDQDLILQEKRLDVVILHLHHEVHQREEASQEAQDPLLEVEVIQEVLVDLEVQEDQSQSRCWKTHHGYIIWSINGALFCGMTTIDISLFVDINNNKLGSTII